MIRKHEIKTNVQRWMRKFDREAARRRKRLRNRGFTIIANDCWGAEVYKDFDLPFGTPLIGTFVAGPCFMKLVEDPERILRSPIRFVERSSYAYVNDLRVEKPFPIGVLADGVEINFLHYDDETEAAQKWNRRVARIDFGNLAFKLSGDKDLFTDADLARFDALPLRRKLALTKRPHPELRSVVCVPDYVVDGKAMYERSLRRFDIVAWLDDLPSRDL